MARDSWNLILFMGNHACGHLIGLTGSGSRVEFVLVDNKMLVYVEKD